MVTLAGEWYGDSGTFWAAAAVVATLIVGIPAAWAAVRAVTPKLRLEYELQSTTDLLGRHGSNGLAVTHNGAPLASPHVAYIVLTNDGRKDIVSSMFHNLDPLTIDLGGVPAIGVLDVKWSFVGSLPAVSIDAAGKINLAACHLPSKSKVEISVVLDSDVNQISLSPTLVDVKLRETATISESLNSRIHALVNALSAVIVLIAAVILDQFWK
ncbi:hypothetical protein [Streptomyces sp. I8-5]|uniref:hypothetical protein n=1 Tax=Streptomyces sp. I8-5 TaxID=3104277 RepID=UPI003866F5E0